MTHKYTCTGVGLLVRRDIEECQFKDMPKEFYVFVKLHTLSSKYGTGSEDKFPPYVRDEKKKNLDGGRTKDYCKL